jgi:hypothetical protein
VARKILTRNQAATAKKRAAAFTRNVLNDDGRANEIEDETLEDWAEKTGRTIKNPKRQETSMAQTSTTKADLQDTLDNIGDIVADALDPASERADLVAALQEIDSLVSGDDDEDDDADDDDNGDDYDDPN